MCFMMLGSSGDEQARRIFERSSHGPLSGIAAKGRESIYKALIFPERLQKLYPAQGRSMNEYNAV